MDDTRSNKVLATLSIIDALNFDDDDLSDLTGYLARQCGFEVTSPVTPQKWTRKPPDESILKDKTNRQIHEEVHKELQSIEAVGLSLPPVDAYNLVAIVQAAIVSLDLPEHSEEAGTRFVNAFCDRYRIQMPTIVQVIEAGWDESQLVTAEEFEQNLDKTWRDIARDVQAEMGGGVKITVDKPHQGALCPVDGEPCSKGGNFYYYPNDCPAYGMCDDVAARSIDSDMHDEFFEVVKDVYQDVEGVGEYLTIITRKEVDDDDLEDRCASGHTN